MDKRLIVNADGFGFTFGNNRGIMEAITNGIVTSVSVNTSFPAVAEVIELSRRFPRISVGVHYNLQVGQPVSRPDEVPSLVREDGEFHAEQFLPRLLSGRIRYGEMVQELKAQTSVLTEQGIRPTHFDGHQNKHLFPPYFSAALSVARSHGIQRMRCHRRWLYVREASARTRRLAEYYSRNPMRGLTHFGARILMWFACRKGMRMADRLISPSYADNGRKYVLDTWTELMRHLPAGVNEIYCHPGYPDATLAKYAKYVREREHEIEVLCSEELRQAVSTNGVRLISFHEI